MTKSGTGRMSRRSLLNVLAALSGDNEALVDALLRSQDREALADMAVRRTNKEIEDLQTALTLARDEAARWERIATDLRAEVSRLHLLASDPCALRLMNRKEA